MAIFWDQGVDNPNMNENKVGCNNNIVTSSIKY